MNIYLKSAVAVLNAMSRLQGLPNSPKAPAPDPAEDAHKLALDYGKSMFLYHAGQRHAALNYYFVVLAAIVTGIVTVFARVELWTSRVAPVIVSALAMLGGLLCVCFWSLDKRNQALVDCDKELLLKFEGDLVAKHNLPFGILRAGDEWARQHRWTTYRRIVPSVLITFALVFAALALIAWLYHADIKIPAHQ